MLTHVMRSVGSAVLLLTVGGSCSQAELIDVIVSRVTGQISLVNSSESFAPIAGYSINSPSGSLLPGNWLSITANYDGNNGGEVDPNDNWTPISAATNSLAEGDFGGDGGMLAPGQTVSLGLAWDPFREQDLEVNIVESPEMVTLVEPIYRSFAADFNGNLVVNRNDLALWQSCFVGGCGFGDADLNGKVDGRDYMIWLSEAGSVGPISPPGSIGETSGAIAATAVIPEPGTRAMLMTLAAAIGIWATRHNRTRAERPVSFGGNLPHRFLGSLPRRRHEA